ncbi:MAG: endonuclease MutS2, partial [Abditibacteriota bacterium]|nr:endonuclease MutS2 [Abditibacteriota bacterium]
MKIPEFDKIKNLLMAQCSTSLGIDTVARLEPVRDFDLAKKRQRETDDAVAVLGCEGSVPLGGITDIRDTVKRASLGSVLSGKEPFSVYETLSAVTRLRSFLLKLRFKYILLGELGEELMSFPHIERSIETSVGEGGEVLDGASVALSSIRRELRTVQARITEKLSSIIASERYQTMNQDPVVTIRADRYCVPIKSDYKGQFPGIVHGMSASGATLFVEPRSIVEMG